MKGSGELYQRSCCHEPTPRHASPRGAAICFAAAATLLAACAPPESSSAPSPERPNILLILADDLGYGDLGAYNPDSRIPTPNLDRLASEGMRLTDAHSPSAVCTPTRYALLTGRYAWRSRLKSSVLGGRSTALIEPGRQTLPAFLQTNGYATAGIGKWHLGSAPTWTPTTTNPDAPTTPRRFGRAR